MSRIAIDARGLGKRYRIGVAQSSTLKDALRGIALAPFRLARSLKSTALRKPVASDELWALRDVSFEVEHGEVLGVIGRNGAGKSTLLKILCRITDPTTGSVEVRGRVGSLLEVGTGFHGELTGRENVYLNGAILGMTRREMDRKFDEIVAFAEVERFLDTPIKHYSSGMQVRLAFAVAAHLEPDILFIDEVLAVGDAEFQRKCLGKLQEVARGGRTVLFVSHSMPTVANLCTRTILLEDGRIALNGNPSDVIHHYLSLGGGKAGEIRWHDPGTAPGNDEVRLDSVALLDAQGRPSARFRLDEEITIRVSYRNYRKGARYLLNINLKDEFGSWVLTAVNAPSASLGEDRWFDRPHPVGLFHAYCRIPALFLNNLSYSVYVAVSRPQLRDAPIQEEDVLSFDVHDTGVMSREYNGPWLGPVRPRLSWKTEFEEPARTVPHEANC